MFVKQSASHSSLLIRTPEETYDNDLFLRSLEINGLSRQQKTCLGGDDQPFDLSRYAFSRRKWKRWGFAAYNSADYVAGKFPMRSLKCLHHHFQDAVVQYWSSTTRTSEHFEIGVVDKHNHFLLYFAKKGKETLLDFKEVRKSVGMKKQKVGPAGALCVVASVGNRTPTTCQFFFVKFDVIKF
ncbi:hypothetical protein RB195_012133 [Necator americanus]|uniref:THAP-type domain-containing protein n=1 Tax=Necator americanus TaxID=51031 RepID=A0ABR1D5P6_NECAM